MAEITPKDLRILSKKLSKVVEMFRSGEAAKSYKWWHSNSQDTIFYPVYDYLEAKPLYEEVVKEIILLPIKTD